ncbi:MAG TPA: hypothetical protein VF624_03705 [Tepidisphaeraceae bacterium]|jgi:hypothetical protein
MTATKTIPFRIELRRLYRGSDDLEHDLQFGVVGTDEPVHLVIASDLWDRPHIIERHSRGGLELCDRLVDRLAIKCFKLMASTIIDQGGDSGWWTIADVTGFVSGQLNVSDGDQVLTALSRQVREGFAVEDVSLVADEDAI